MKRSGIVYLKESVDGDYAEVSLVSNYRGQFNRIINSQGDPELLKKLRTKSEEIKAP